MPMNVKMALEYESNPADYKCTDSFNSNSNFTDLSKSQKPQCQCSI